MLHGKRNFPWFLDRRRRSLGEGHPFPEESGTHGEEHPGLPRGVIVAADILIPPKMASW